MFVVKCPECGEQSKAFPDQAGRSGKCPHCGRGITLEPAAEMEPAASPPQAGPRRRASRRGSVPDTGPPGFLCALVALGLTSVLFVYGELWFAGTQADRAWQVLRSCLWIGKVEAFMFLWGLALLLWKTALWGGQRRPLRWQVLPGRFAESARISPSDADACLEHVRGLSARPHQSILLNRVVIALNHLRRTQNVQEVRGALTGQSAIDANLLDSSYAVLRFLIWVVPILGFIGTVLGIGLAVAEFADFIPKVSEIEAAMDSLRRGLGQVTAGLGTAFNTTLVALCLVAPLMLLTSWLRKQEEHLLAQIDHFSNHDLLASLADGPAAAQDTAAS